MATLCASVFCKIVCLSSRSAVFSNAQLTHTLFVRAPPASPPPKPTPKHTRTRPAPSPPKKTTTQVIDKAGVETELAFGACVWATGIAMNPLIKTLQVRACARARARPID